MKPGAIDFTDRLRLSDIADRDNAISVNRNIAREWLAAHAVINRAVAYDDIVLFCRRAGA
jgi:hypothetical protein